MTVAGIDLALARRESESEMRERCTITRPGTGQGPWSDETLSYGAPPDVVVYTGKCKLRFTGARARRRGAVDQLFVEQGPTLSLPVLTSVGIAKDDRVELTASPDDLALVGRIVWVDADRAQTNATSRRIPVRETQ